MKAIDVSVHVNESGKPGLVMFWGPNCGPCAGMKPVAREVAEQLGLHLYELNITDDMETVRGLGIRGIPTFGVWVPGHEVKLAFTGAAPAATLKSRFEALLP